MDTVNIILLRNSIEILHRHMFEHFLTLKIVQNYKEEKYCVRLKCTSTRTQYGIHLYISQQ